MPRGGARAGAGRPKGRRNRRTEAQVAAIEAGGITPLAYLLAVMRDQSQDRVARLEAAKVAAPYVHPKLAAIDTTVRGTPHSLVPLILNGSDIDG